MKKHMDWQLMAATIALILLILSWQLTVVMFGVYCLFGPRWFGPLREWTALGVSLCLHAFHLLWGRRILQKHLPVGNAQIRGPIAKTSGQAVLVVVIIVAIFLGAAVFGVWLFARGRG
jgi:hypothetical protein